VPKHTEVYYCVFLLVHLVGLLKENTLKRQNYLLGHFSGAKRCPYQIIACLMWECFQGLLIANFCLIFFN
jgi:hypothetical protein